MSRKETQEDYLVGLAVMLGAAVALGVIALKLHGWRSMALAILPLAPFVLFFCARLRKLGKGDEGFG